MHHCMPPSKTGWPSLNVVIFPPVLRFVLNDPKQIPPRRLLIKFTSYSWKTVVFRLNQYQSNWTSHVRGLGASFMKIWTCGDSPRSGSWNAWKGIKNFNGAILVRSIWNFFSPIQMISCRTRLVIMAKKLVISVWPGDKATINGVAAYRVTSSPKKFRVQKSAGKVLVSIFGDQDGILLIDYLRKGQVIFGDVTHFQWCNWRTFWGKNVVGSSKRLSFSCTTMPRVTKHL